MRAYKVDVKKELMDIPSRNHLEYGIIEGNLTPYPLTDEQQNWKSVEAKTVTYYRYHLIEKHFGITAELDLFLTAGDLEWFKLILGITEEWLYNQIRAAEQMGRLEMKLHIKHLSWWQRLFKKF